MANKSMTIKMREADAKAKQEEIRAELMAEGLTDEKSAIGTEKAIRAQKADDQYWFNTSKSSKEGLTKYQYDLTLDQEQKEIQNLIGKSQKYLNEITASNLLTNDQLVEMQTKIQQAQFDFINSDWFKTLPKEMQAVFMMLRSKLGGM